MNELFDTEKFAEVKERVIENTHTREDVLFLLDAVENFEAMEDELVVYTLEEQELNADGQI